MNWKLKAALSRVNQVFKMVFELIELYISDFWAWLTKLSVSYNSVNFFQLLYIYNYFFEFIVISVFMPFFAKACINCDLCSSHSKFLCVFFLLTTTPVLVNIIARYLCLIHEAQTIWIISFTTEVWRRVNSDAMSAFLCRLTV